MAAQAPLVLVVEDEPAIAELVSLHLKHHGYRVALAADTLQAQAQVNEVLPALVLLDWMLPGGTGVSLAQQWRAQARTRDLPIIMLTARAEESDRVQGLDAGADDYLTKPFSMAELMARIRSVMRRRAPQQSLQALTVEGLTLEPQSRELRHAAVQVVLGPTESRVLHTLMAAPGRVYSRAQLLDLAWGDHVHLEDRTVDVHIKRLRETMAPTGCSHWVRTVRGAGYRFQPGPPEDRP